MTLLETVIQESCDREEKSLVVFYYRRLVQTSYDEASSNCNGKGSGKEFGSDPVNIYVFISKSAIVALEKGVKYIQN